MFLEQVAITAPWTNPGHPLRPCERFIGVVVLCCGKTDLTATAKPPKNPKTQVSLRQVEDSEGQPKVTCRNTANS
ncbi:hypothetical protein BIW11_08336, partial [Tropilaelaps mercedesae]